MPAFYPFSPEDQEIVIEALNFTKEKILRYYQNILNEKPRILHDDIDRQRSRLQGPITDILKIFSDPQEENKVRKRSDLEGINDIICSSLNVYATEWENAIDPEFPASELRFKKIKALMNGARLSKSKADFYSLYSPENRSESLTSKLLFFSYSSDDKGKVGKIAKVLEDQYSYEVFKAHEDIEPDQPWREVIKQKLDQCDGFITYLTIKFRYSPWTHQESGWVMKRGIPMYSLVFMKKIPGFLEERQGVRLSDLYDVNDVAKKIHEYFSSRL